MFALYLAVLRLITTTGVTIWDAIQWLWNQITSAAGAVWAWAFTIWSGWALDLWTAAQGYLPEGLVDFLQKGPVDGQGRPYITYLAPYWAAGNHFFPLDEILALTMTMIVLVGGIRLIRWILGLVPTMSLS